MAKKNTIIYWVSTGLLSFGMFAGGIAQLFRVQANVDGITHLGYPIYFLSILGTWKLFGVLALLIPKYPLLKEWAYAGLFFAMTGATISHIASGDTIVQYIAPIIFSLLTIVSWYYRPDSRKIFLQLNSRDK
jgi:hypothetical protein